MLLSLLKHFVDFAVFSYFKIPHLQLRIMSHKPVFLMSHLRALSTAVERVSSISHISTVLLFSIQVRFTSPFDGIDDHLYERFSRHVKTY